MMANRHSYALLASVLWAAGTGVAGAAETVYPHKPIRLIIPFPPGGSADPLGRAFGTWFSERFAVPVVADNRPGAGTAIAHTMGARAAPDGYTLLLGSSSGMAANPAFGAKLDYHPIHDFAHIGHCSYVPQLIAVHPAVPAKTMRELIDLAKAQPEKIRAGSPGVGTLGHLSVAYLNSLTGARLLHVPYKGTGPAMTDLLANRIQTSMSSVTGSLPHVQSGRLRAVAVGHPKRINQFPDVPTVAETLPGFANDGWYGLLAPAGTPPAIVARLNAEMNRALSQPEFQKQIDATGMVQAGGTPAEWRDFVANEVARWTKVVRDAGLNAQSG